MDWLGYAIVFALWVLNIVVIIRRVESVERRMKTLERDLKMLRDSVGATSSDVERLVKRSMAIAEKSAVDAHGSWRPGSTVYAENTGESIADYALGKKSARDYGVPVAPTTIDCDPPDFARDTGDLPVTGDIDPGDEEDAAELEANAQRSDQRNGGNTRK